MNSTDKQDRSTLQRIAREVMLEKGLLPEFSGDALLNWTKFLLLQQLTMNRFVTLGIFYGLPLIMMIHLTWINSLLPK